MSAAPDFYRLEWGSCVLPPVTVSAEVREMVRSHLGAVPGWLEILGRSPWLPRTECSLAGRSVAFASRSLCELVELVVSQDNSCRYCYGVQRALMRIAGYKDAYLDRLERDLDLVERSPAERAALAFARTLSRANPRPARAELQRLVELGMAPEAAVEIAAIVSIGTFMNRLSTFVALPPERRLETATTGVLFTLVRPFIARRMRGKPRAPVDPPTPNEGAFANIVTALGRSPLSHVVRQVVDDAWTSDVLPLRTKALMLAVVARALGCAYSENEARTMLTASGMDAATVDEVLAHLGSPSLSPLERQLVPFARETVHYQPVPIQARVRELATVVGPDELLEGIAIASLANALCRLSVVLDAC